MQRIDGEPAWQVVRELSVQFSDTDANRHLNNVAVARLFQDSRSLLLGGLRAEAAERFTTDSNSVTTATLVVVHVGLDYKAVAHVHEPLVAMVRLGAIGSRSFEIEFRLERHEGQVVASGRCVCCIESNGRAVVLGPLEPSLARLRQVRIRETLARL